MSNSDSGTPTGPPSGADASPGKGRGIAGTIDGDMQPCWLCGRSVSARALFCHACGAVQAPRDLDCFTRLGMERRFDIDLEMLGRQHAGFTRALDPNRFAARGARQQAHARAQVEALAEAFDTLRDPVRRARYLLGLMGLSPLGQASEPEEEIADLRKTLLEANEVLAVDRLAHAVGQRIEACIKYLAIAFRNGQAESAALILARLEQLEALSAQARDRRISFSPDI